MSVRAAVAAFLASFAKGNDDAFYDWVTLSMHFEGASGSATFTDASKYNRTPTVGAVATLSTQARQGATAGAFTGAANSHVQFSASTDHILPGDFTIETWVNADATQPQLYPHIVKVAPLTWEAGACDLVLSRAGWLAPSFWAYNFSTSAALLTATTNILGRGWTHVAVTRSGSVFRIFINGVKEGEVTWAGTINAATPATVLVGGESGAGSTGNMKGYVDELRITKGVCRYIAAFAPPSRALPDQAPDPFYGRVASLLHFEGADGSATFNDEIKTVTWTPAGGGATITAAQSRAGASSLSLNGASRLTTPIANVPLGTADFVIEGWVRPTAVNTYQNIFSTRGTGAGGLTFRITNTGRLEFFWASGADSMVGGAALVAGAWQHVALVRQGSIFRTYLNGVLQSQSVAITANLDSGAHSVATIGAYGSANSEFFSGHLDEFRITIGLARYVPAVQPYVLPLPTTTDPYWAAGVTTHLKFNGTNGATTFTDEKGKVWTAVGNAQISTTAQPGMDSGTLLLDGAGDSITTPTSADYDVTGDFTIEATIRPSNITGAKVIATTRSTSGFDNGFFFIHADGKLSLTLWNAGTTVVAATSAAYMAINTTYRVAACRFGNTVLLFSDGNLVAAAGMSANASASTQPLRIGSDPSTSGRDYAGNIDEFRFTKGVARYPSSFVLAGLGGAELPVADTSYGAVVSLLHFDDFTTPTSFRDNTGRAWSRVTPQSSAAAIMREQSRYGGGALKLNGSTDALITAASTDFMVGAANDFTVEAWVNADASQVKTYPTLWECYAGGTWSVGSMALTVARPGTSAPHVHVYNYSNSTALLTATTDIRGLGWVHVALSRIGSTWRLFINGHLEATATWAGSANAAAVPMSIGGDSSIADNFLKGCVDEFRFTRLGRYDSAFVPPGGAFAGKTSLASVVDAFGLDAVLHGQSQLQSGANGVDVAADGPRILVSPHWVDTAAGVPAGIQVPIPSAAHALNCATGDFTIQFWVYAVNAPDAAGYGLLDIGGGYNYSWPNLRVHCFGTSGFTVALRSTSVSSSTAPDIVNFVNTTGGGVTVGAWVHVAFVRQGSVFRLFRNGVQVWTITDARPLQASNTLSGFNLGSTGYDVRAGAPSFAFKSYFAGVSVKAEALYVGTFTPPARPT